MSSAPNNSVFITGVSSGIGHGLAQVFHDQGWQVYGISRRLPEDLTRLSRFRFASADLTMEDQVVDAIERLFGKSGSVDVAILNAGQLGELGDMFEVSKIALLAVMDINVWSCKTVLDELLQRDIIRRQVVAISSGASVNGNRGFAGYSISKAALNMMTRLYSREFPTIHFCSLAPGVVDTPMQEELARMAGDERFEAFRVLSERRRLGEMPQPHEAADHLFHVIAALPESVESGEYADIREDRFHGAYPRR